MGEWEVLVVAATGGLPLLVLFVLKPFFELNTPSPLPKMLTSHLSLVSMSFVSMFLYVSNVHTRHYVLFMLSVTVSYDVCM